MLFLACFSLALSNGSVPIDADRQYLTELARDTWHCISDMECPDSGLPYDNSTKGEYTSVSNTGIYLTSILCAEQLGFIQPNEASQRLHRTLNSVTRLKTWYGFQQSWNSVKTLQPNSGDTAVSVLDSANLCAGLLSTARLQPDCAATAMRLFKAHDWWRFYDRKQATLLGGLDTASGVMNPKWHLDALGTDATLAQFFAIATNAAPLAYWKGLRRDTISWEGENILWPGWDGGGLFMQFISGIWLDLNGTELGQSEAAFARAQIKHMTSVHSPVWGWSACNNPEGGYLGWGALRDTVVTPHASALTISLTPHESIQNLHELERLGVRSPSNGFYDAYDWKSKRVAKVFLTLDQGMLLISLTNFLKNDAIHIGFQTAPVVQRGRQLLGMP